MNLEKPLVVIPDVHGRFDLLELILKDFPEHNYVFLGDIIDRGDDSRSCLKTSIALAKQDKALLCYGNHEIMAWMAYKDPSKCMDWWLENGGHKTLKSYSSEKEFKADLLEYIGLAKHYHIVNDNIFAHAGIPAIYGTEVIGEDHLWLRPQDGIFHPAPDGVSSSYHGHTPMPSPKVIRPDGITSRHYFDLGMKYLAVYEIGKGLRTYGIS